MDSEDTNHPVRNLISAVHEQMMIDFQCKTAIVRHPGERGSAREDILKEFLQDYMPERFGMAPGFIVDAHGKMSKQIDIVIYDKLSCPKFKVSDRVYLFPIESVAGVISVKSRLDKEDLVEANNNLQSVISLDRCGSNRTDGVIGGVVQSLSDLPGTLSGEPVFTAIFAYESPKLETVATSFTSLLKGLSGYQRIQVITVLNRGTISFLENGFIEPTYSEGAQIAWIDEKLCHFRASIHT